MRLVRTCYTRGAIFVLRGIAPHTPTTRKLKPHNPTDTRQRSQITTIEHVTNTAAAPQQRKREEDDDITPGDIAAYCTGQLQPTTSDGMEG